MILVLEISLFILGTILLLLGRVDLDWIKAEGRMVRYAGGVLMLPLGLGLGLGLLMGWRYPGEITPDLMLSMKLLEICAMIGAVLLAGILLNADQDYQRDSNGGTLPQAKRKPVRNPNILSVEEAAAYLNTTPQDVQDLISTGRIPAARGNGGYAIARSALDDLHTSS